MKKYLITGFSGFVSRHFLRYLESQDAPASILGIDRNFPAFLEQNYNYLSVAFEKLDLLQKEGLDRVLHDFQPDYILHLASFSSVAYSWQDPINSFRNNTNIFLNLLEAARATGRNPRILSVGSSEEYGNVDQSPLTENMAVNPISPYAVARVSQEMLSKVFVAGFGMDIVLTRSFNHIGAAQRDTFVIPSFVKKIIEAKRRNDTVCRLNTGDLSIVRDFVDVRDVVRAYELLLQKGKKGKIYNICSGSGVSLREMVEKIAALVDIPVEISVDPKLIRPNDNKVIVGSNTVIREELGWSPTFSLEESLNEIIAYWNATLQGAIAAER